MIEVKNLVKTFKNGDVQTQVLKGIDFQIHDGEFIAIMGGQALARALFCIK